MDFIFDPSLVLYLPLGELDGASLMSRDAYGHLYTLTGALWRPNGRWFDGTDDVISISSTSLLNFGVNTDFTLEVWVKPENTTDDNAGIVSKKSGYFGTGYSLNIPAFGSTFRVALHAESPGNQVYFTNDTDLPIDWYHIVGTYDRDGKATLYINVDLEVKSANMSNVGDIDNTGSLNVGKETTDRHIGATIGEVRIYKRVLSPLEVRHNYLATKWRYR